MINDRSVVAVSGFNTDTAHFYEAASVAAFNQAVDGGLCAYVTFYISSAVQTFGVPFAPRFLWGNIDLVAHAGWAIQIAADNNGNPLLQVIYGDGAIEPDVSFSFTGAPTGLNNAPNYVERLIQAGLFIAPNGDLSLTINGAVIDGPNPTGATYVPSTHPARLGVSPVGTQQADLIGIVGCGYYGSSFEPRLVSGQMYQAARESIQGGAKIIQSQQLDWTHRYEFGAAAQNLSAPSLQLATPVGPAVIGPYAPLTLNDLANAIGEPAFLLPPVASPVALTRASGAGPVLSGIKNPEWYQGGCFTGYAGGVA